MIEGKCQRSKFIDKMLLNVSIVVFTIYTVEEEEFWLPITPN